MNKYSCIVETYPEKEKTSLANFLSKAVLEALVSTRTTLMWPGLSLTRLLVYVMSVSSVTSTKSFLGGRLHGQIRRNYIFLWIIEMPPPLFFLFFLQPALTLSTDPLSTWVEAWNIVIYFTTSLRHFPLWKISLKLAFMSMLSIAVCYNNKPHISLVRCIQLPNVLTCPLLYISKSRLLVKKDNVLKTNWQWNCIYERIDLMYWLWETHNNVHRQWCLESHAPNNFTVTLSLKYWIVDAEKVT